MSKEKVLLSLMSIGVFFMGYLLYLPLPDGFENPWRARKMAYGIRAAESLAYLMELITGTSMGVYLHQWSIGNKPMAHKNYPELEVKETRLDGVRVMVYRRKAVQGSSPAVVYFHGGGWTVSDPDRFDGWNLRLALMTNMTVVAVDYWKAPKSPYPGPFEDCLKVTLYLLTRGDQLGVNSKRVAVIGHSAGGNLAAAVALRLSREKPSVIPPLKFQVLLSPALQALTFNTVSYKTVPNTILSQERMIMFWAYYLGIPYNSSTVSSMSQDRHVSTDLQKSRYGLYTGKAQSVKVVEDFDAALAERMDNLVINPFIAPLMADEDILKKAPPAYVIAYEYDQLRDEALMYADRLKESGVRTEARVVKGQTHPSIGLLSRPGEVPEYEALAKDVAEHIVENV